MSRFIKWLCVVTVALSVAFVGALSLTACNKGGNDSQTESPSASESPSGGESSSGGGQSTGGEESSSGSSDSSGGEQSSSSGGSGEEPTIKTYTVTFDVNLGEKVALDGVAPQSVTENEGGTIILPVLKSLNYQEFSGWRVKGTSKILNGEYTVEKDVTLVAVWKDLYTDAY